MNRIDKEPIYIGLFGLGNIGTGVSEYLLGGNDPSLVLEHVVVRDLSKPRAVHMDSNRLSDNPQNILGNPKINIVVELMGGEVPALTYIYDAIGNGKSVVTANKKVLARHIKSIFDTARLKHVDVGIEASVGGGIQLLNAFSRLRGEEINRFFGVLNGTTNYILTGMAAGGNFDTSLKGAQENGFAEPNHLLDTGGYDTQDKLAVTASVAWETQIDVERIQRRGILDITAADMAAAKDLGYVIKLLAFGNKEGDVVDLRVTPALLRRDHPLAVARNEFNMLYLEGSLAGPQTYYGRGAGPKPTTSAVISDIRHIAENIRRKTTDDLPDFGRQITYKDPGEIVQDGYIRVGLAHEPGSLHFASGVIFRRGLNMEDSIQRRESAALVNGREVRQDIITISPAPYKAIKSALKGLSRCKGVYGTPFFLPIVD